MPAKKLSPTLQAYFDNEPESEHPYIILKKLALDAVGVPVQYRLEALALMLKTRLPVLSASFDKLSINDTRPAEPVSRLTLLSILSNERGDKRTMQQLREFILAETEPKLLEAPEDDANS